MSTRSRSRRVLAPLVRRARGTTKSLRFWTGLARIWLRFIWRHPANQGARLAAVRRAVEWQIRARLNPRAEALIVIDGRTKLLVRRPHLSSVWMLYDGLHEWEELQLCLGYLRPGDHFVDVGANVGVFSAVVASRLRDVRITAIEPFPSARAVLEENLSLNQVTAQVVDCAAGAEAGTGGLEIFEWDVLNRVVAGPTPSATSGVDTLELTVRRLDELVGDDPPALIKIDVEGSELDVLRGARALLMSDDPPVVLFEHCGHGDHYATTPADVQAFLREVGFTMHLLDGDLTPWPGDGPPPTPNVVAMRSADAVRARLAAPGGARCVPPVRVSVQYRTPVWRRG